MKNFFKWDLKKKKKKTRKVENELNNVNYKSSTVIGFWGNWVENSELWDST